VGYESASAFVAAFRRETGRTPASYFHQAAKSPWPRLRAGPHASRFRREPV